MSRGGRGALVVRCFPCRPQQTPGAGAAAAIQARAPDFSSTHAAGGSERHAQHRAEDPVHIAGAAEAGAIVGSRRERAVGGHEARGVEVEPAAPEQGVDEQIVGELVAALERHAIGAGAALRSVLAHIGMPKGGGGRSVGQHARRGGLARLAGGLSAEGQHLLHLLVRRRLSGGSIQIIYTAAQEQNAVFFTLTVPAGGAAHLRIKI